MRGELLARCMCDAAAAGLSALQAGADPTALAKRALAVRHLSKCT